MTAEGASYRSSLWGHGRAKAVDNDCYSTVPPRGENDKCWWSRHPPARHIHLIRLAFLCSMAVATFNNMNVLLLTLSAREYIRWGPRFLVRLQWWSSFDGCGQKIQLRSFAKCHSAGHDFEAKSLSRPAILCASVAKEVKQLVYLYDK